MTISMNELLRAVEDAARPVNDDGMTVHELADATSHGEEWIRRRLRLGMDDRSVAVGWRTIADLTGRLVKVPVYRITHTKKRKK